MPKAWGITPNVRWYQANSNMQFFLSQVLQNHIKPLSNTQVQKPDLATHHTVQEAWLHPAFLPAQTQEVHCLLHTQVPFAGHHICYQQLISVKPQHQVTARAAWKSPVLCSCDTHTTSTCVNARNELTVKRDFFSGVDGCSLLSSV